MYDKNMDFWKELCSVDKRYWDILLNCDLGTDINPMISELHDLWCRMQDGGAVSNLTFEQIRWVNGYTINTGVSAEQFNAVNCLDLNYIDYSGLGYHNFWEYIKGELKRFYKFAMEEKFEAERKARKRTSRRRKAC